MHIKRVYQNNDVHNYDSKKIVADEILAGKIVMAQNYKVMFRILSIIIRNQPQHVIFSIHVLKLA